MNYIILYYIILYYIILYYILYYGVWFCFTWVLFQGKQTWLIQKHVLIGKIIVTDWLCNSNNGEWKDNEQLEVRADDAACRRWKKERLQWICIWMIFIRATGVEKGGIYGGREGRGNFSISICHSFFMRFLSLDILDFPLAFFLTVVWVQALSEFITFVNR